MDYADSMDLHGFFWEKRQTVVEPRIIGKGTRIVRDEIEHGWRGGNGFTRILLGKETDCG
jgi:hypothetical protein